MNNQGNLHKDAMLEYRNVPRVVPGYSHAGAEIRGRYYDVAHTIPRATAADPGDADALAYVQERVYDAIQRRSEQVMVINDDPVGGSTLFVRISHDAMNTFSPEAPIYPQETKVYLNVYELRLRSPLQGLNYRVTEYAVMKR